MIEANRVIKKEENHDFKTSYILNLTIIKINVLIIFLIVVRK